MVKTDFPIFISLYLPSQNIKQFCYYEEKRNQDSTG